MIDTIGVWCLQRSDLENTRVRVRDLCHGVGDPEEAASGTTNGALACLIWKQGRAKASDRGCVRVSAEQGFEMGRPSLISSELLTNSEGISEVRVGDSAMRRLAEPTSFDSSSGHGTKPSVRLRSYRALGEAATSTQPAPISPFLLQCRRGRKLVGKTLTAAVGTGLP